MAQPMRDEVVYYYDMNPTEEDLMGEAPAHARLIHYLMDVLTWLFQLQICAIHENFNMYQTDEENEKPLVPDIAIIKGIAERSTRSYRVGVHGPVPQVVFEVGSVETWKRDLLEKPQEYAAMGVQEYYAYDPCQPMLSSSRKRGRRLYGWHRDAQANLMREVSIDLPGMWSPELNSYLQPDGSFLRLLDRSSQRRPTQAEALEQQLDELASLVEIQALEIERAKVIEEKLRSMGIDPDQLR